VLFEYAEDVSVERCVKERKVPWEILREDRGTPFVLTIAGDDPGLRPEIL
jgi:hypothetical protein